MAKQAITLKIAGKSYPFNIESGKEEMYRLAEREVNSYLALIKQQNIKNWNDQDYLSMTALKFAIANVGMRQSREVDSEDLRQLGTIHVVRKTFFYIQESTRIDSLQLCETEHFLNWGNSRRFKIRPYHPHGEYVTAYRWKIAIVGAPTHD